MLFLIGIPSFLTKENVKVSAPPPPERTIEVLVAKEEINPGEFIAPNNFTIEPRPAAFLDNDVITSFDDVAGKVPNSIIPKGFPVLKKWLSVPTAPVVAVEPPAKEEHENPILQRIRDEWAGTFIRFGEGRPTAPSRIAIGLINARKGSGEMIMIIDDAWILEEDRSATPMVYVNPERVLFLQSVSNLANRNLTFVKIPMTGPSPYEGKTINTIAEVESLLGGQKISTTTTASNDKQQEYNGYAWVTGTNERWGIDKDNKIQFLDSDGRSLGTALPWSRK